MSAHEGRVDPLWRRAQLGLLSDEGHVEGRRDQPQSPVQVGGDVVGDDEELRSGAHRALGKVRERVGRRVREDVEPLLLDGVEEPSGHLRVVRLRRVEDHGGGQGGLESRDQG
nr:hypothetical protein GCM10025730_40910 [Promicromonospora thailandica]